MEQTAKLELCELGPDAYGLESISPFCLKAHRALKFYGMRYERRHAMRPSEHKAVNPGGQLPVLLIDGKPVPDSTAIIKALEKLSPKSLVPDERRQRAEAWGSFSISERWKRYFPMENWRIQLPGNRPAHFRAVFSQAANSPSER